MSMPKEKKAEIVTSKLNHLSSWLYQQDSVDQILKEVKADARLNGEQRRNLKILRDREYYNALFTAN